MTTTRTAEQRYLDWLAVYTKIKADLTPEPFDQLYKLSEQEPDQQNVISIQLGMQAARITFANDRAAAVTAAMITQSGVSRPIIEIADEA